MANKGWDSAQGGDSMPSNARQTGRVSGKGNAEAFVRGSRIADPGKHCDPLDQPSDRAEVPGQMSTC